jgi:hypothetical protein
MVLPVPSDMPHHKGNESQDMVSLLETVLMLTKKETQIKEGNGFVKFTG